MFANWYAELNFFCLATSPPVSVHSISFQFPCVVNFKKWGWPESEDCRLCKALYPKQPAFAECLEHIQGYCKALQKPRIAAHHGIWRDLVRHIGKQSLEEHEEGSRIWKFPTSVSAVKHGKWEMREILTHMGLMTNMQIGHSDVGKEITLFHVTMGYWDADDLTDPKIQVFLKVRPDGVGFNVMARICAFLSFFLSWVSKTRPITRLSGW